MREVRQRGEGGGRAAGWFVRRAGLARATTLAAAFGLSLAALTGPELTAAIGGLAVTLALLMGYLISRIGRGAGGRPSLLAVAAIVLVGLFSGYLLGGLRVAAIGWSELSAHVGATVRTQLTITGTVRSSSGWISGMATVDALVIQPGRDREVEEVLPSAAGESVLFEMDSGDDAPVALKQGTILTVKAAISEPQSESASGFDQRTYLRNHGIAVVLRGQPDSVEVLGVRGGAAGWFDRLRESARAHLSRGPDARLDELLQGIVMGDTVGLDAGWVEAFRRSGTAHMLSVSGLHVASLAAIMIGLAKLARAPRWAGFFLAAAASVLMIPFVGASPPVVRSVVMIVIVVFGQWAGRRRDQWQVLGLAAAVVLALNPYGLFDAGFQLSFAAFAGMLTLLSPIQRLLGFLPRTVASNAAVSIAASVGTAPVSLAVFGRTSLVAVFANLLVVPTLPIVTGLGMASVLMGFLWSGLSTALDVAVSPALAWTVQVSRLFAAAPILETRHLWRSAAAVCAAGLVAPAALALAGRTLPARLGRRLPFYRTAGRRLYARRPRDRRLAAALAAVALVSALLTGWAAYPPVQHAVVGVAAAATGGWPDVPEVRVLDIGQGNAVLVRTPDHHALLFDCGPSGCRLEQELRSLGVTKLDLVVISHPHADHFAGLLDCVGGVEVDTLVDRVELVAEAPAAAGTDAASGGASEASSYGLEARSYLELRTELERRGCRHALARDGTTLSIGGATIRLHAPESSLELVDGADPWALRAGAPGGDEMNAGSIVALVSWGGSDLLLPGDAEAEILKEYDLPSVEVLVVGHHGSRAAVSSELLETLGLQAAVISVGKDNAYGHPDPATMSLLGDAVGTVLRTDLSGWVSFAVHDDGMSVTTEKGVGS